MLSSTLMLILIPTWLRQKADHPNRSVDFHHLAVVKFRHQPVDAHNARLSVLTRDHYTVLQNPADLREGRLFSAGERNDQGHVHTFGINCPDGFMQFTDNPT
jgi:hypothetical protein